jgi:hypothetical protein
MTTARPISHSRLMKVEPGSTTSVAIGSTAVRTTAAVTATAEILPADRIRTMAIR